MPEGHQKHTAWNAERKIGPNTAITVKAILSSHRVEQQGYKGCMGLDADHYGRMVR
jgi:hypothetical protein